ncbi:MAG: sulfurtransferase [Gammaproteobacteria bacterium]|nr:sulfurtransferase [Gammaproteobacteria bacterium]
MKRFGIMLFAIFSLLFWILPVAAAPVMVDGEWLSSQLDAPKVVLIDMSSDETQYQRFHLPGAIHLPYKALTQRRKDGVSARVSDQRLYQILGILGVKTDSHVVIYDDIGGLQAGRLFWELERIGHKEVSVLNGGLVKWILDGRPVENRPVERLQTQYLGSGSGRANEAVISDVKQAMEGSEVLLLDVRTEEEYRGSKRNVRSGHVPGALLWPWQQAVAFKAGFVATDSAKLESSLKLVGVEKSGAVIAYCRTGHRASQAYLTLRSLGYEQVKMYDGSMSEWSLHKELPMKKGRQP